MNSGFSFDIDTAKVSWQVLQAAISDLIKKPVYNTQKIWILKTLLSFLLDEIYLMDF